MHEKNQINTEEFYELNSFNSHKPFWQIGMIGGLTLNLSITTVTENDIHILDVFSLKEYPFFLFLLCFYDSRKLDYEFNNYGEKIITKSYEQIMNQLEIIEQFLGFEVITLDLFNENFSNLDFNYYDSNLYVEYINTYKIFFQLITVQLKEWLNKNLKNQKSYQFLVIGY